MGRNHPVSFVSVAQPQRRPNRRIQNQRCFDPDRPESWDRVSPEGAEVRSPGREPRVVTVDEIGPEPRRGDTCSGCRPFGASCALGSSDSRGSRPGLRTSAPSGLTHRPSGPKTRLRSVGIRAIRLRQKFWPYPILSPSARLPGPQAVWILAASDRPNWETP